jgi:hypothetical protein
VRIWKCVGVESTHFSQGKFTYMGNVIRLLPLFLRREDIDSGPRLLETKTQFLHLLAV